MFAGNSARDEVIKHLNGVGNAMNLQHDIHAAYNDLEWGIEAREENGNVRSGSYSNATNFYIAKVKYIYRRVPYSPNPGPKPIPLKDGDEIIFGSGPDGMLLNEGPLPRLCNLHLTIARVLKMSGAADIIFGWKNQADDDGFPHVFIASEEFCNILDARLLLSGHTLFD